MSKKPKKNALPSSTAPSETPEGVKARAALMPEVNGALVIEAYQKNLMGMDTDLVKIVEGLQTASKHVCGGDLAQMEAMLIAQATALQTIFASLAKRAALQEHLPHYQAFLGLAFKAQAQSRATISALVELKHPRHATFVQQANIATGPQQVNNGMSAQAERRKDPGARADAKPIVQNELLEVENNGSTNLDVGTTTAATSSNTEVEALGAVHRAQEL